MLLAAPLLALAGLGGAAAQDARLIDAARTADAARVTALLEQGASANARQADGATALHWAAHWDDAAMAGALVRAGAAVDAANDFGATPLWLAAFNGSATMVAALLSAGADANAALPSGETVLMTASRTGSAKAVRLLASRGADVNARERSRGQTALMWAVAQQHPDVVEALVALGADVHARSSPRPRRIHTRTAGFNPAGVVDVVQGGNTPLLFAARQGGLDVPLVPLVPLVAKLPSRVSLGASPREHGQVFPQLRQGLPVLGLALAFFCHHLCGGIVQKARVVQFSL